MNIPIGKSIRSARLSKGISQSELALKIGRPRTYISKVECGQAMPAISSLQVLADGIGIESWRILRHALRYESRLIQSDDSAVNHESIVP